MIAELDLSILENVKDKYNGNLPKKIVDVYFVGELLDRLMLGKSKIDYGATAKVIRTQVLIDELLNYEFKDEYLHIDEHLTKVVEILKSLNYYDVMLINYEI